MSETFPEATEHWHSLRVLFYHYHLSESLNGIIHSILMHCDGMMWRVLNHYTVVRDNKGKSAKYEATHENRVTLLTRKMAHRKWHNFYRWRSVFTWFIDTFLLVIICHTMNYDTKLCYFLWSKHNFNAVGWESVCIFVREYLDTWEQ